jgi:hypothetical protein
LAVASALLLLTDGDFDPTAAPFTCQGDTARFVASGPPSAGFDESFVLLFNARILSRTDIILGSASSGFIVTEMGEAPLVTTVE